MEKLDKKSVKKWLEKGIIRISRGRSRERNEDDKREPHKISSPFVLEAPHTHQDSEEAIRSPATLWHVPHNQRKEEKRNLWG